MDGPRIALKVNDRDNVATIFANGIHNGSEVELIFKYGEEIGIATQNIRKGDHVHIQNLDSLRGRGDLPKREGNYHGV